MMQFLWRYVDELVGKGLPEIGDIQINQSASKDEIFEMLDFYRESMGC